MPQRGVATYNTNPASYVVRRNVKQYGAKGSVELSLELKSMILTEFALAYR